MSLTSLGAMLGLTIALLAGLAYSGDGGAAAATIAVLWAAILAPLGALTGWMAGRIVVRERERARRTAEGAREPRPRHDVNGRTARRNGRH